MEDSNTNRWHLQYKNRTLSQRWSYWSGSCGYRACQGVSLEFFVSTFFFQFFLVRIFIMTSRILLYSSDICMVVCPFHLMMHHSITVEKVYDVLVSQMCQQFYLNTLKASQFGWLYRKRDMQCQRNALALWSEQWKNPIWPLLLDTHTEMERRQNWWLYSLMTIHC